MCFKGGRHIPTCSFIGKTTWNLWTKVLDWFGRRVLQVARLTILHPTGPLFYPKRLWMIAAKRSHQVNSPISSSSLSGLEMVLIPEPVFYLLPISSVEPCMEMMGPTEAVTHCDEKFYSRWVKRNILRVSKLLRSLLKAAKSNQ